MLGFISTPFFREKNFLSYFFSGGGFYLLGVQALTAVCIIFWGICSTFILLWLVNKITPLRMSIEDEILGADFTEHNISTVVSPQANEEKRISQRFRLHDEKMTGKTYFTDELSTDRSKATSHENPAFQQDESA